MSITLNWQDNSYNESGFVVERSTDGNSYQQYHTASSGVTTYVDANVTESNTYWYRISAFNAVGVSSYSSTASLEYTSSVTPSAFNDRLIFDINGAAPFDVDVSAPVGSYLMSSYPGYQSYTSCSAINCSGLTGVVCADNFNLSYINVSGSVNLTEVDVTNNLNGVPQLTILDVSTNVNLVTLKTGLTGITSIDVSNNPLLTTIECYQSGVSTLDVTNLTGLLILSCHQNNISTLNITNNSALTTLYAYVNSLTTIDVSGHPDLDILDVMDNNLTQIAVDNLLVAMVNNGHSPSVDNYIDISGTNAYPSATGLAAISTLEGNGWTVYY